MPDSLFFDDVSDDYILFNLFTIPPTRQSASGMVITGNFSVILLQIHGYPMVDYSALRYVPCILYLPSISTCAPLRGS